jgi:hypothetical protein
MLRSRRNEQRFAPPTKALAPSLKTGGRLLVAGSGSPTALIAAALLRLRRNEEAKGCAAGARDTTALIIGIVPTWACIRVSEADPQSRLNLARGRCQGMQRDIDQKRETKESLGAMFEKTMETKYGASRDTCREARRKVLGAVGN